MAKIDKEIVKLPLKIQELYREFIQDLERDGLGVQGWELKKMCGSSNEYRAKLIIIIKVASREGAYK